MLKVDAKLTHTIHSATERARRFFMDECNNGPAQSFEVIGKKVEAEAGIRDMVEGKLVKFPFGGETKTGRVEKAVLNYLYHEDNDLPFYILYIRPTNENEGVVVWTSPLVDTYFLSDIPDVIEDIL